MPHNRIKKYLSRRPRELPAESTSRPSEHFALLPLAGLPPAIQHAAAQQASLYRWAYEQAISRLG